MLFFKSGPSFGATLYSVMQVQAFITLQRKSLLKEETILKLAPNYRIIYKYNTDEIGTVMQGFETLQFLFM